MPTLRTMVGGAFAVAAWLALGAAAPVSALPPEEGQGEGRGSPLPQGEGQGEGDVQAPEDEGPPGEDANEEVEGLGGSGPFGDDKPLKRLDAIGVPLVSFNSDLGWGVGLVGGGYYYHPEYTPYRHALAAQSYFTTRGVQNHWLRYDGPDLLGEGRLEIRAEFRRELFAPFYGVGNLAGEGYEEGVSENRLWAFDHFFPGGWARVRTRPGGEEHPLEVYGGYGFNWVRVTPYEGSRLSDDLPRGTEGGAHGRLLFGAAWDSRDHETDPSTGGVEEIAMRLSAAPFGSRYSYGGVTFSERRFFSLGTPRLILAQRLLLDVLFGDPPFFEWAQIGGTQGGEGIGGMSSGRGVPRNRYQGNIKAVSNTELRFYVFDFPLFGEPVKTGGVIYWDMGRVWHPGVDDGAWYHWHPGAGGGLRLARRAAVIRFDYAVAVEDLRQGIYVTFGHMF